MTVGFIARPTTSDYLHSLRKRPIAGGAGVPGGDFRYPVFKGRRRRTRGAGRWGKKKKRMTVTRRRKISGKGIAAIAKLIWPYLKQIPSLFRSKAAKKIATSIASSGVAAGVNLAADKLSQPKVPLKKLAKVRGAEAIYKVASKVKDSLNPTASASGSGGRRRRRRGVRRIKRKRLRGGRRRRRASTKRKRRVIKKRANRQRSHSRRGRRKRDIFDE